jgi:hypothetical protein
MGAYGNTAQASKTFTASGADLVGWWKFDDNAGTAPLDSSGQGKTGKFISAPVWTAGKLSRALRFDGINDAVQIPTKGMSAAAGTICFWAYPRGFDANPHYLFGHTSSSPAYANRIQLYTDDAAGNLDLGLGNTHARRLAIFDFGLYTWYHIALTWNSGSYAVYVNGTARASGAYTGLTALGAFADIGNDGSAAYRNESFNGVIDDVRIYNRALTAAEIYAVYKP